MLINLLLMNWMFSIMFMFLNHPLSLGCILLIQTIIISLTTGYFYYNFWFSYILFLIMIGGMLVMFIYMTSIASNEKFKMPKMLLIFMIITLTWMITLTFTMDNFFSNMFNMTMMNLNKSMLFLNMTLSKFFSLPMMKFMITLMIYLLFTLIAVVKITGKSFGTLRQKY